MKRIIDIDEELYNKAKNGEIEGYNYLHLSGKLAESELLNEVEAEDCRSLKDIKEMIKRKADALDGQMLDAGGVCIGLYFAIANDIPTVYPKSDKPSAHWIERFNEKYKWLECDNCHGNSVGAFNYCPHCGSPMI